MEEKLNRLHDLLGQEIVLHEALKKELQQEAERDGQMDGLSLLQIQQTKHRKSREIQHVEQQRIALVGELAALWSEGIESLTLNRIIELSPAEMGALLRECHARLMGLVEDIRKLAKITSANAQARLKAIDATLAAITEAVNMHPTYSEAGRLHTVTPTFKQTSA